MRSRAQRLALMARAAGAYKSVYAEGPELLFDQNGVPAQEQESNQDSYWS